MPDGYQPAPDLSCLPNLSQAPRPGALVRPDCLTIGLVSDLHTDEGLAPEDVPCPDVDVWVAAGDIATQKAPLSPVRWLNDFATRALLLYGRRPPILFVPGNHDFHHGSTAAARRRWAQDAVGTSVYVLENKGVILAGVRFLGTPLWSDLSGVSNRTRPRVVHSLRQAGDFGRITLPDGSPWTPEAMVVEHARSYRFLANHLLPHVPSRSPASPLTVVISHFGPHLKANHPMFVGGLRTAYFATHLPELCVRANLWLFGHTHTLSDFVVDAIDDRADVERYLVDLQDRWVAQGGRVGPWRDAPLFDSRSVRAQSARGRVIAHPHGHRGQHVPGRGSAPYTPLVLRLFRNGRVERSDNL